MFGYAQFYGTKKAYAQQKCAASWWRKDEILRYCTGKLQNNLQRLEAAFRFWMTINIYAATLES